MLLPQIQRFFGQIVPVGRLGRLFLRRHKVNISIVKGGAPRCFEPLAVRDDGFFCFRGPPGVKPAFNFKGWIGQSRRNDG